MLTSSKTSVWQCDSHEALLLGPCPKNNVVLSTGCFDGLHEAHIEHLRQASEMGDYLVVGVTSDYQLQTRKLHRPHNSASGRMEQIAKTCPFVDAVFINDSENSAVPIFEIRPSIYVKGPDYINKDDRIFDLEKAVMEHLGGEVRFTTGPELHTSEIIERTQQLPRETLEWIRAFKIKYPDTVKDIEGWIIAASVLTASVIGEKIEDEYVYVTPVGRSTKDPIVTFREVGRERFLGGASAIAAHQVGVYGEPVYTWDGTTSMRKTRYIVHPFGQKVFSHVTSTAVDPVKGEGWDRFTSQVMTVADYGHGLIADDLIKILNKSDFLSLMAQANSLNWGFNTLNKYPRADFFVCNEPELRLAAGSNEAPVESLLIKQINRLGSKMGVATLGDGGCIVGGENLHHIPAFASKVVDRIGSGDAFLAVAGPLAALGEVPADIIGFVGSVAAAIQVETIGNSEPITRERLMNWIRSLLA